MQIFFNSSIVYENQTINLINDYSNRTFQIACASITSKPDVTLSLFDKNSLIPLSTNSNSILQHTCTSLSLCTNVLQINLQFSGNSFNNLTSIGCSANSSNINVPLYSVIYRNVSISIMSNKNFILIYIIFDFPKMNSYKIQLNLKIFSGKCIF